MKRPIILVPPDLEVFTGKRGAVGYAVLQRWYLDAVVAAGGLPVVPPPLSTAPDDDDLDALIALADGLVLPGGDFDIDPALYGEAPVKELGHLKPERTALERGLLVRAEARGLPVLGICGGMQLQNVHRGGTLHQDLPTQRPSELAHMMPPGPKSAAAHRVVVVDGTRTAQLCGAGALGVNSTHHQAVKALGRNLVASAHAEDGLVEALEDPSLPFYVGVQWHPEAMLEPAHHALYRGLVNAARDRAAR